MTTLATFLDSLAPEQLVGFWLMLVGAGIGLFKVVDWILAGPTLDDTEPVVPVVPRPRVHSRLTDAEWRELLDLQAQARADIALESGDFEQWEAEVSA